MYCLLLPDEACEKSLNESRTTMNHDMTTRVVQTLDRVGQARSVALHM